MNLRHLRFSIKEKEKWKKAAEFVDNMLKEDEHYHQQLQQQWNDNECKEAKNENDQRDEIDNNNVVSDVVNNVDKTKSKIMQNMKQNHTKIENK